MSKKEKVIIRRSPNYHPEEIQQRTKTWDTGFHKVDEVDCNMNIPVMDGYFYLFLSWLKRLLKGRL